MKITHFNLFMLIAVLISLNSCKDKFTKTYQANIPIYMDYDEWRNQDLTMQAAKTVENPGKLWIKDQYLFINEPMKGVHVFNNSIPSNPINIGFIPVISSLDIAVKGNVLFVDSYTDIISFDITNPEAITMICRTNDVFKNDKIQTSQGYNFNIPAIELNASNGVIIGWEQQEVTEEAYASGNYYNSNNNIDGLLAVSDVSFSNSGGVSAGGSMASFAIYTDYLYVIEGRNINSFHIEGNCLTNSGTLQTQNQLETLFTSGGYLYVGTTTGMLIYTLQNTNTPLQVGNYPHVGSCDPVVVQGNRAYVTLRTGNACVGDVNQLVVVNIEDKTNPYEIKTYEMTNPHGLGLDNNTLFLCDGSDGLKVYDKTDDYTIDSNMISHFQNINTFDVIPYNDVLIMTAKEGIYQYDYSDVQNITQLSLIPSN